MCGELISDRKLLEGECKGKMEEHKYKSEFLKSLNDRGYIKQCTDAKGLDDLVGQKNIVAYIGFDCTAKSLHVGSLMQIMMLRMLQRHGHQPIVLFGGATTRIGDPSDKDEMRKVLSHDEIEENKKSIAKVFHKFLDCSQGAKNSVIFVDNIDWFEEIKYLDFLRSYGAHFSINRMLTFESVKRRLDRQQPLSFLEFNYMLLQGYDFVELSKRYGCVLQFGGSEQWGNIVSGIDLARRVLGKELFGITTPLLTKSDGSKMGKTAQGAVWIDESMLSAYDYWQFWRNTDDKDVIKFLRIYTDLPMEEIERLSKFGGREINDVKIILANEATKICHGAAAAQSAFKAANTAFVQGDMSEDMPNVEISEKDFGDEGMSLYKLLVVSGMSDSGGGAKRLIRSGGVKINDVVFDDHLKLVKQSDFDADGKMKLSVGKKRHCVLNFI